MKNRDLKSCFVRIYKNISTKCKICGKKCKTIRKLSNHVKKEHQLNNKKYYDKFYKEKGEEFCQECGEKLKFRKLTRGYGKYCSTDCMYKSDLVKKNREKTNLELYGVKNCFQSEEKKKKIKEVQEKLYGGMASASPIIRKKIAKTNKKKYGVDNIFKDKKFQRKQKERMQKYKKEEWQQIQAKAKKTKLGKYGDENYCNVEKILQTKRKKYGDDWMNSKKMNKTKKKKIEQFEKQYNCIEKCKVIKIYGNQAILKDIKMLKSGFRKFVPNEELKKIEDYINNDKIRKGKSRAEKEVLKYIKKNYKGKIEENTKKIITPLELDIYIPKLKIAVEYNGSYWHSKNRLGKYYHFNKTMQCKAKGIRLIHIFEDDWINKKDICKTIILKAIKKDKKKTSIKKCKIEYIDKKTSINFIDKYDICEKRKSGEYIGIYNKEEIIGCIIINNNKIEIKRIVFKPFIYTKENVVNEIMKFLKKNTIYLDIDNAHQDISEYSNKELKPFCINNPEKLANNKRIIFDAGTQIYKMKKGDLK